jgi:hypothetical protein
LKHKAQTLNVASKRITLEAHKGTLTKDKPMQATKGNKPKDMSPQTSKKSLMKKAFSTLCGSPMKGSPNMTKKAP